jgi:methyltransferase-like protein/SAM-dependent methyltransferase
VPYRSVAFAQTHPNRLATLGTLLGMRPAPAAVADCRVLELGCGRGENLIPLALELPDAELVGIDLSERQIRDGRAAADALGADNLTLEHGDIMALGEGLGDFDYILAHGVYSWVPAAVRDRLLAICARLLRPHGIVFVSYNCYPGWHMNGVVRDAMLFHTRGEGGARERLRESQRVLDLLCDGIPDEVAHYRTIYRRVQAQLREPNTPVEWLYHEFLEDVNEPVYFREFAQHAARHGLQFLSEANLWEMNSGRLPEHAVRVLAQLGDDLIRREQYLDFINNRTFRQTLLCHRAATLDRNLDPGRIAPLHAASNLKCLDPESDIRAKAPFRFVNRERGVTGATDHPLTKAALLCLTETWPATHAIPGLAERALARLGCADASERPVPGDVQELSENLLSLYAAGAVELHLHPPRFAERGGDRPLASPWARYQLAAGGVVTNLRHHGIDLPPLMRRLLPLLDGTRTRAELIAALLATLDDSDDLLIGQGAVIDQPEARRAALEAAIEPSLERLARWALLVQ